MGATNRRLVTVASMIVLLCISVYAYLTYNKVAKEKWLSSLDITTLLIESGDLLSGYSPGTINNLEPDDYSRFVQAKEQQILASDGRIAGITRIYLFSIEQEQGEIFNLLSLMETPEGLLPIDATGIGEMQLAAMDPFGLIVFTRCTSIGYIQIELSQLQKGYATDLMIAHARRLDKELKTIACKQP